LTDELLIRLGDEETRERLSAFRGELVPSGSAPSPEPGW